MSGSPPIVIEVKRGLDGSERRFRTELVHREPRLLVVLYRIRGGPDGDLDSYGCFWPRRPYDCYHMVRPPHAPDAGHEVATRFDVVRGVEVAAGEVRYLDLLLDLDVRDGEARWEDEDELAAALREGRLGAADGARVEAARGVLARGHRRVTAEVRALLRRLGRIA